MFACCFSGAVGFSGLYMPRPVRSHVHACIFVCFGYSQLHMCNLQGHPRLGHGGTLSAGLSAMWSSRVAPVMCFLIQSVGYTARVPCTAGSTSIPLLTSTSLHCISSDKVTLIKVTVSVDTAHLYNLSNHRQDYLTETCCTVH